MKFWQALSFTEADQLVALAPIVEEVGFHGAFVSDHVFVPEKLASHYPYSEDGTPPFSGETDFPDAWCAISAMAAVTTRLCFNTAIYIAPLRHPLEVAKAVATASVISNGRVCLGVGVGWVKEEYEQLGHGFHDRGRRLDEMIEVLRKLWAGGPVEHHGTFYDFDRLQQSPAPPARVPIYVGGSSAPALRRAARLGDGWLGSGNDPAEVNDVVGRLGRLRAEAGRGEEPFDVVMALTAPPDVDLYRRLEDQGVTSVTSYPLAYTIGPGTSLEAKRAALEAYGDRIISRL